MMNKKLAIVSVAVAMVGFAMTSGAMAWPGCLNGGPGMAQVMVLVRWIPLL